MITCFGICLVGSDDFFKDVTHCDRACGIGVEVHFGKRLYNLKENVLLDHELHFLAELEILKDLLHAGRVCADEFKEVGIKIVAIANKILKSDALCIVERNSASKSNNVFDFFWSHSFLFFGCFNHLGNILVFLCKDAVKTANDRHGNDYVSVFFGGIGPSGFICNAFNQINFFICICCKSSVVHIKPHYLYQTFRVV